MKVTGNIEIDIETNDQADADAVVTLLSITLANWRRTLQANSTKVGTITFTTEVEE